MIITLKYQGTCVECGNALPKGLTAHWMKRHRRAKGYVICLDCKPTKESIARNRMAEEQRAWNYSMYKRHTCPTCEKEKALSQFEADNGFHCIDCTRADEFGINASM